MRLLQRGGQDTFIMATDPHLGELLELRMWYNCVGPSPSWCCKSVLVSDLETHKQWFFKVNQRLSLANGKHYIVVKPTGVEEEKTYWNRFLDYTHICNPYHTWRLTSNEVNFSHIKRSTGILSAVLTQGSLNLLLLVGIPSFELKDFLDFYDEYTFDGLNVFLGMISSFLSFCVHISIFWGFR